MLTPYEAYSKALHTDGNSELREIACGGPQWVCYVDKKPRIIQD